MFADRIVASLNYASRPTRHDSVPQAHKNTFQWAFDLRISKWFGSGSGTFWVSGKPGLGKSTFMKFIARHSWTKHLLTRWAGSADTLAVAVHFFWVAGTPIQKSWQGLLQSLFFDVCYKHPSVVPLKMCFFTDGLDEYDNNYAELCKVLCDMANPPHIKMYEPGTVVSGKSELREQFEFLYRTVKDFVLTKDMGEYLRSNLPSEYNSFISIAAAYLDYLKTICQDNSLVAGIMRHGKGLNSGPFISHLNQALVYASEALKSDQCAPHHYQHTTTLLDRYEIAVEAMVRTGHVTIRGVNSEACNPRLPFREELLRRNLTSYIRNKISEQLDFFIIFDESPLFAALTPMVLNSGESPVPVTGTLEILLQRSKRATVGQNHRSL
ncbi:hypothetical protein F4803DRAFT_571976 [Xylaria telfairii]|nr:hypothetical protein F4803DRAFT_571976 [Xylaria telfairii]